MKNKMIAAVARRVALVLAALMLSFGGVAHAASVSLPPGIQQVISEIQDQLNLTKAQQAQLAVAVAKTQTVVAQITANHEIMQEAVEQEMQNSIPNLDELATDHDDFVQANIVLKHSARAEWLKFYDMLSADQVAVLKTVLNKVITVRQSLQQLFPLAID